jgi:hypothetical protein
VRGYRIHSGLKDLQHPGKQHETAALRAVHYLATTSELALTYGLCKTEAGFYGTCDASPHGTENGGRQCIGGRHM